uniref:AAA+ ATPase domain-containing protein n=1 Tax=Oryza barthii TaxID=65489 RepID=A0A0D3GZV3_9ORYZ
MAEVSAAMGSIRSVRKKLAALLSDERKDFIRVRSKVKPLIDALESVHACFEKLSLEDEKNLDALQEAWMMDLRELSYDMEDSLDRFLVKSAAEPGSCKKLFKILLTKIKGSTNGIVKVIQDIKMPVEELNERMNRFKLSDDRHVTYDPIKIDSRKLVVVSIVGPGGLGKTTLANQVYHHLKPEFDCSAFVSVGQNPDVLRILGNILSGLTHQPYATTGSTVQVLVEKTRRFIADKRYLVLLDDIWNATDWEMLRYSLPDDHSGSRIITTTRIVDVARYCSDTEGHIYKMDPLSDLDSQRLFFTRIFGSDDGCPTHLKRISMDILKRCGGLPLAILTLASTLANVPMLAEKWKQVHNSIGLETPGENMNRILSLSFHDLPIHLKTCLLYLSIFPEDYVIEREQLVWRWIAEGFIPETRGIPLERVGSAYFNELINRSMIQPADVQYDGTVQSCRVHDMILELIVSISTKINFVAVLHKDQDETRFTDYKTKVRRLAHQSNCIEKLLERMSRDDLSHIRSIIPFDYVKGIPHLGDFQALRVLDLGSCRSIENHHIENLEILYQLKYLDLSRTSISELPMQIDNLRYLETLDLRGCAIEKLPASIVRLQNMQRLLVNRSVKFPDEIGHMQALQMLLFVSMSCNSIKFVEELRKLIKMRVLNITFSKPVDMVDEVRKYTDSLVSSLNKLVNLESLKIDPEEGCSLDSLMGVYLTFGCLKKLVIGYISRIPKWINPSMYNLVHLELKVDIVREEDLHSLELLRCLLYLQLEMTDGSSKMLTVGSKGFRCLRESQFIWKNDGMGLVFLEGAMPELRTLHLYFRTHETTANYSGVDGSGIDNLSRLNKLCVDVDCSGSTREEVEAVEDSIRKAADRHRTKLTLEIQRWCEACMIEEEAHEGNAEFPSRSVNRRANPVRVAFRVRADRRNRNRTRRNRITAPCAST